MPLETATYINQLEAANPLGSDPIASGDDHIRLIKATVKATFPNITGPVTVSQADINGKVPNAVQKDGSVIMTGELTLSGNPANGLSAAPKQYIDAAIASQAAISANKAEKTTVISAGAGLTGGGDLSTSRSLAIATTGVSAGTYGSTSAIPVITVNDKGQLTSATTTPVVATRGLGFGGERWNNVTGSRASATQYTNSRSYPIVVSATGTTVSGGPSIDGYVDGTLVSAFNWQFNGAGARAGAFIIVPPGSTYQLNFNGCGIANWAELY